jgi:hypothetical protein
MLDSNCSGGMILIRRQQPPPASERRSAQQVHAQAFHQPPISGRQAGRQDRRPTRIDLAKQLPAQPARLLRFHAIAFFGDRGLQGAAIPLRPLGPGCRRLQEFRYLRRVAHLGFQGGLNSGAVLG